MLCVLCAFWYVCGCNAASTAPAANRDVLGPPTTVGNGTARTFVVMAGDRPLSVGIQLSDAALQNLPVTDTQWQLALPTGV
jgi:hypothetical protein